MNDKEYTYDIDKYTIGVDENGEDGIGLTISIIKNGEINFLGNCYGENARCIDLLIKQNKKLEQVLDEIEKYIENHKRESKLHIYGLAIPKFVFDGDIDDIEEIIQKAKV